MDDIKRLESILAKLRESYYLSDGHLRVCQIIFCATQEYDSFYVPDEELDRKLGDFIEHLETDKYLNKRKEKK